MVKKSKSTILVVDDEVAILRVMEANLRREGYDVHAAEDGLLALEKLKCESYDTVIIDYMMPRLNGLDLMAKMKELRIDVPVVVVTAHGTIEHAVQAMQMGAVNYLTKPVNYDELALVVKNAVQQQCLRQEVKRLRREVTSRYSFDNIVGQNEKMQTIFQLISDVAETDATVLIRGETGTGKELIAKALHFNSPRRTHEFIRINCAALTETLLESELFGHEKGAFTGAHKTRLGRFEQADGGTLFFDEIGDIPLSTQSKLLRVLQEKEFERVGGNKTIKTDVRIISATNRDLEKAVAQGAFRQDLFYRLNVIPIDVPPLRERIDDIPLLAFHFVKLYSERFKRKINDISQDAIHILMSRDWPGNIRQLENVIERAVILEKTDKISAETLNACIRRPEDFSYRYFINENIPYSRLKAELLNKFEREYLTRLLDKHKGNITKAAKDAGIHYKNFCEKMKRHNISKWDFTE
ncbi:MAG: sigma-54-dependent Fis family transcriptional regulator [Calditrichaeota bacterium]|nr:MAG: sigma-54-dependent Fis family transcriptional regulator [Calditrichota bacterium]